MTDRIHIEQLELYARVGVTEQERANPQRLTLTVTVWPRTQFDSLDDDITKTVNYSAICAAAREFAGERSDRLIETLANGLASHFLQKFPLRKTQVELHKFILPDAEHVSVIVARERSDQAY